MFNRLIFIDKGRGEKGEGETNGECMNAYTLTYVN